MERFKDESEELRDQMETLNADKEAEYKKLKEMITSLESQKRVSKDKKNSSVYLYAAINFNVLLPLLEMHSCSSLLRSI